jgi:hypothetical protein
VGGLEETLPRAADMPTAALHPATPTSHLYLPVLHTQTDYLCQERGRDFSFTSGALRAGRGAGRAKTTLVDASLRRQPLSYALLLRFWLHGDNCVRGGGGPCVGRWRRCRGRPVLHERGLQPRDRGVHLRGAREC